MNGTRMAAVVLAAVLLLPIPSVASDDAVIIQAYLPEETEGLDWGDGYQGPKDELRNDCFLMYQMLWGRPGIDGDHGVGVHDNTPVDARHAG